MMDFDKFVTKTDRITARSRRFECIRLHLGEPTFEFPSVVKEKLKEALVEALDKGVTRYTPPAGLVELREVIADKLWEKNGIDADSREIIVTAGGTAALSLVFRFFSKDSFVAIPDPGWFAYPSIIRVSGADVIYVPEQEYGYEALLRAREEARKHDKELRIIVINSPSNPTGYVFNKEQLKEIIDFAEDYSVYIVSDEVYEDFILRGENVSPASLSREHVFSVYSLSKTYGLTGLRIGYLVAPDREIARKLTIAQLHTYVCTTSFAQYVALVCIREHIEKEYIDQWLKTIRDNINYIDELLIRRNIKWRKPIGGIYVWFPLPNVDSWEFALKLLEEKRVSVAVGEDFGTKWNEYIRVLTAADAQVFRKGVKRIFELYDEIAPH